MRHCRIKTTKWLTGAMVCPSAAPHVHCLQVRVHKIAILLQNSSQMEISIRHFVFLDFLTRKLSNRQKFSKGVQHRYVSSSTYQVGPVDQVGRQCRLLPWHLAGHHDQSNQASQGHLSVHQDLFNKHKSPALKSVCSGINLTD